MLLDILSLCSLFESKPLQPVTQWSYFFHKNVPADSWSGDHKTVGMPREKQKKITNSLACCVYQVTSPAQQQSKDVS